MEQVRTPKLGDGKLVRRILHGRKQDYTLMALPEGVSLVSTSIWTSKFALSENYCPVALITVPSQARTQQPEPASNGLENRCDKLL
jgi:hypothetical protein